MALVAVEGLRGERTDDREEPLIVLGKPVFQAWQKHGDPYSLGLVWGLDAQTTAVQLYYALVEDAQGNMTDAQILFGTNSEAEERQREIIEALGRQGITVDDSQLASMQIDMVRITPEGAPAMFRQNKHMNNFGEKEILHFFQKMNVQQV